VQSRFHSISMLDASTAFIGGGSGDIYYTTDAGTTWTLDYGIDTPIYALDMYNLLQGVAGVGANLGAYIKVPGRLLILQS
jgi:photosystem II stability/assembly factor-like uncharacterized protein